MSKIKKILAVLVTLAMVMAMSVTAFAANITVTNADKATLSYVQIISADPATSTGWKFINGAGSLFTSAFDVTDEQQAIWMLILAKNPEVADDERAGIPAGTTAATAAQIANALDKVRSLDHTGTFTNGVADVSNVGVYAIKAVESGYNYKEMAAYVGFGLAADGNYPTVVDAEPLVAKKAKDGIDDKTSNDTDKVVAVGDIVTFTITAEIPYFNPSDSDKTYKIVDTLTGADYYLSGTGSVASVTVEGYSGDLPSIDKDANSNSFTLDFSRLIDDANTNAGKKVTIVYTAKITAVDNITNKAEVKNNTQTVGDSKTTSLYTGQIELTKYAENGTQKTLSGAEFKVTKDGSSTDVLRFDAARDVNGTNVYKYNPSGNVETVVTGTNGKLIIEGLDVNKVENGVAGTYHFEETKAPEGYSINKNGADATIKLTETETQASAKIKVSTSLNDSKLNALPSTGGIGTTIFTVGGCLIMIAAAALFFVSRRKASNK